MTTRLPHSADHSQHDIKSPSPQISRLRAVSEYLAETGKKIAAWMGAATMVGGVFYASGAANDLKSMLKPNSSEAKPLSSEEMEVRCLETDADREVYVLRKIREFVEANYRTIVTPELLRAKFTPEELSDFQIEELLRAATEANSDELKAFDPEETDISQFAILSEMLNRAEFEFKMTHAQRTPIDPVSMTTKLDLKLIDAVIDRLKAAKP